MLTQIRLFDNIIDGGKVTESFKILRNAVLNCTRQEYVDLCYLLNKGGSEIEPYRKSIMQHLDDINAMCEIENFSMLIPDNIISRDSYVSQLLAEAEMTLSLPDHISIEEAVNAYSLVNESQINCVA